jgi:putative hemolysin
VTGELILIGVLIVLNAFFAASEIAIISSRKGHIHKLAEEGNRAAQTVQHLFENYSRFLATIQIGITVVGFLASAIAAVALVRLLSDFLSQAPLAFLAQEGPAIALVIVTLCIAFLTIILGELVPKGLAIQHADAIALAVARPIKLLSQAAAPIIAILTFSSDILVGLLGGQRHTRRPLITAEEIRTLVHVGEREGAFPSSEAEMIYGIIDLSDKGAHEIMVPRTDIVALKSDATFQEALDTVVRHGYSRIPVYQGSLDNIVGILYAKDLLRHVSATGSPPQPVDLVRPAFFVPESKRIDELLRELQQRQVHMAIVVDEYGGTAGLVTIEDLLEEIVGEIRDEYDREEPQVQRTGENEAILDGRVSIDDLNELFELDIQPGDFDTVGGLVLHLLGKMPSVGDTVQSEELSLSVLSTTGKRINKVRATKLEKKAPQD